MNFSVDYEGLIPFSFSVAAGVIAGSSEVVQSCFGYVSEKANTGSLFALMLLCISSQKPKENN